MPSQGYDPSFAQAAHAQMREMMAQPVNAAAGCVPTPNMRDAVSGIEVQFLANGFLVGPRMDYIGGSINRVAHVARDKDELLKLVGEMIDAHAK